MKRSEAIDLVWGILHDFKEDSRQAAALQIMKELEKAGMLPPKASILSNTFKTVKYDLDGNRLEGPYYESLNMWEPEDATKE